MLSKNPRADEKEREKAYYDGVEEARKRNRDARRAVANWDIIEKDGENDTREEDPLLRYIDRQNNKIDWYSTMRNLAGYGKRSGYSEGHYKRCKDRWVSFFAPDLRPITEPLSADKAGSFLSSLTIPDSDLEIVERNLKSLKRKPGEKLFSVISHLSALAERMYQEYEEAERLVLIERILFNGLWCFTTGETKRELGETLQLCSKTKVKPVWTEIYEGAMLSEERHGTPTIELAYANPVESKVSLLNVDTRIGYVPETIAPLVSMKAPDRAKKANRYLAVDTSIPPPPRPIRQVVEQKVERGQEQPSNLLQWRQENRADTSQESVDSNIGDNDNDDDKDRENQQIRLEIPEAAIAELSTELSGIYEDAKASDITSLL
jgi:hypothetical protein